MLIQPKLRGFSQKTNIDAYEVGLGLLSLVTPIIDWCRDNTDVFTDIEVVITKTAATYFWNRYPMGKKPIIVLGAKALVSAILEGVREYKNVNDALKKFNLEGTTGVRAVEIIVLHEYAHALVTSYYGFLCSSEKEKPHGSRFIVFYEYLLSRYFSMQ